VSASSDGEDDDAFQHLKEESETDEEQPPGATRSEPAKVELLLTWKGAAPPEEIADFQPTDLEAKASLLVKGPDPTWHADSHSGANALTYRFSPGLNAAELARKKSMTQIDEDKVLARTLKETAGTLLVFLNNRLRALAESHPELPRGDEQIQKLLEEAIEHGSPELAEAAAKTLMKGPFTQKVQAPPDTVWLSTLTWALGVGEGTLDWAGEQWKVFDFGDTLPICAELSRKLLGNPEPGHVARRGPQQCLLLHVAAGVVRLRTDQLPTLQKAQAHAEKLRADMLEQALEATECLGVCPEFVSQAESDLRAFLRDLTRRGHDKDYRCLAACPPAALDHYALSILRLDAYQRPSVETFGGVEHAGDLRQQVWSLVHQGHMRLLVPPAPRRVEPGSREMLACG
jgi:hypothetical protein